MIFNVVCEILGCTPNSIVLGYWLALIPRFICRAISASRTPVAIRVTKVFAFVCWHGGLFVWTALGLWRLMMRSTPNKSMKVNLLVEELQQQKWRKVLR